MINMGRTVHYGVYLCLNIIVFDQVGGGDAPRTLNRTVSIHRRKWLHYYHGGKEVALRSSAPTDAETTINPGQFRNIPSPLAVSVFDSGVNRGLQG